MIQRIPLNVADWSGMAAAGRTVAAVRMGTLPISRVLEGISLRVTGVGLAFITPAPLEADVTLTLGGAVLTGRTTDEHLLNAEEGIALTGGWAGILRGSDDATLTIQPDAGVSLLCSVDPLPTVELLVKYHTRVEPVELGASEMAAGEDGGVDVYLKAEESGGGCRLRYTLRERSMVWPEAALLTEAETQVRLTVPEAWVDQFPAERAASGLLELLVYDAEGNATVRDSFTLGLRCPASVCPVIDPAGCTIVRRDTVNGVHYTIPAGTWVQGHSGAYCTLAADAVSGEGLYGATVKRVLIRLEGEEATGAPGRELMLSTGWLTVPGTRWATFEAEDSRGSIGRVRMSITVLAWHPVVITAFTVKRVNADGQGDDMGQQVAAVCQFARISLRNETAYAPDCVMTLTVDDQPVTLRAGGRLLDSTGQPAQVNAVGRHTAVMTVTDGLNAAVRKAEIPSTMLILHGNKEGDGLGVGMLCDQHNAMTVNPAWEVYYRGQTLDQRIAAAMPKIECGTARVSVAASSSGSAEVTFDEAFTGAPRVVVGLNVNNPKLFSASGNSISVTGFTVQVASSYTAAATVTVSWIAIGE